MWNFELTHNGNERIRGNSESIGELFKSIVELVLEHGDNYVGHIIWKTED